MPDVRGWLAEEIAKVPGLAQRLSKDTRFATEFLAEVERRKQEATLAAEAAQAYIIAHALDERMTELHPPKPTPSAARLTELLEKELADREKQREADKAPENPMFRRQREWFDAHNREPRP